jgi:hypothetical protein
MIKNWICLQMIELSFRGWLQAGHIQAPLKRITTVCARTATTGKTTPPQPQQESSRRSGRKKKGQDDQQDDEDKSKGFG